MNDSEQRKRLAEAILDLHGGDPFGEVAQAADAHRESHGRACGLYPAGPHVMRSVATLVRACRPRRLLDLGAGIGYSALWLASACEDGASVEAIDRFPEHIAMGRGFATRAGLSERITFIAGEVSAVLERLAGPYDLVHDDAWFAAKPTHLERVVELLRPGGVLTMPNWFLLEDAITGEPRRDWSEFAGTGWREATRSYARHLASDPRLYLAWSVSPPLAVAVKRSNDGDAAV